MRAIIESGGMQFPVEERLVIKVPKLEAEVGQKLEFDKVLLVSGPEKFLLGRPYVEGARVNAEVTSHGRLDKVKVFKFKRRRKYRKLTGQRRAYTEVRILSIVV